MSQKYVRINANQTHSITPTSTQNLLDLDIPAGRNYNLDKSYVALNARISTTDTNPNAGGNNSGGAGIYNVGIAINNGIAVGDYYPNVALVKHAQLVSEKKGQVESLRDVNKLRLSLEDIGVSEREKMGKLHRSMMGCINDRPWGSKGNFVDYGNNLTGEGASYKDHEIKIPLKDIFNVGKMANFDTSYLGQTRVHLELDNTRMTGFELYSTTADDFEANDNGYGQVRDNDSDGVQATNLVLERNYLNDGIADQPFYKGQKIQVNFTMNGNAPVTDAERIITGISKIGNLIQITVDTTLGLINNAQGGLTACTIKPCPANTINPVIKTAQLVLYENQNAPPQSDKMVYTTYTQEKDNGNGVNTFSRQYELEPESLNMLIHLPADGGLNSSIRPENYRIVINNKETTNRDVFRHTPIYNNRIVRYGLNSNLPIKNLAQGTHFLTFSRHNNGDSMDDNNNSYIYEPLPITDRMKLVQISLDSTTGLREVNIFKEVSKML